MRGNEARPPHVPLRAQGSLRGAGVGGIRQSLREGFPVQRWSLRSPVRVRREVACWLWEPLLSSLAPFSLSRDTQEARAWAVWGQEGKRDATAFTTQQIFLLMKAIARSSDLCSGTKFIYQRHRELLEWAPLLGAAQVGF